MDRYASVKKRAKGVAWPLSLMTLACCLSLPVLAQDAVWTSKAPTPTGRSGLMVGVLNGVLYAIGGGRPAAMDTLYQTVEAYRPATDTWMTRASLPIPCWHGSATVAHGAVYVVGCGTSTFAYMPESDSWAEKAPMPTARLALSTAVVDGVLYAIGGKPGGPPGSPYHSVEAYFPQSDSWTEKAPMPTYRFSACAGVLGGLVYVAGGETPVGPSVNHILSTLESYNPATDTWTTKASMPVGVRGAVCAAIAGKLYVAGGSLTDYVDTAQGLLQIYDPQTDSWQVGPPMPTPRFFAGAGVIEDTLYMVGGYPALSVNEAFSPFEAVNIDIKPGDPNPAINLRSGGVLPVAILGSATFDPMTVDPATVTLTAATDNGSGAPGGAHVATRGRGVPMTATGDVNHDGYPDLILYFRTQDLQLTAASTEAVLYGKTYSGTPIRGSDKVRIVPTPNAASSGRMGPRHGLLRPNFR
jgi:hypothetical protein